MPDDTRSKLIKPELIEILEIISKIYKGILIVRLSYVLLMSY
jgi:hypothetical protein